MKLPEVGVSSDSNSEIRTLGCQKVGLNSDPNSNCEIRTTTCQRLGRIRILSLIIIILRSEHLVARSWGEVQSCEMSNFLHRHKFEFKILPQKRVNRF